VVHCPLALLGSASYPVPVRQPAASLPASFTPSSRPDALRFASFAVTSLREDFRLQVDAHAGRTTVTEPRTLRGPFVVCRTRLALTAANDEVNLAQSYAELSGPAAREIIGRNRLIRPGSDPGFPDVSLKSGIACCRASLLSRRFDLIEFCQRSFKDAIEKPHGIKNAPKGGRGS
jgi:hypothetical protein